MTTKITPQEEYFQLMEDMGLKDPQGLYDSYSEAMKKEAYDWFDTAMKDAPTGEEIGMMLIDTRAKDK